LDHVADHNLILETLPESERTEVARRLGPVELPLRHRFFEAGQPPEHVYFISSGLGSVVTELSDGSTVETVMTGREGCTGFHLALGVERPPSTAFQQIAGSGLRMSTADFLQLLEQAPALRRAVDLYAGFLLSQSMQNAACNRAHDAIARCARWLLLSSDRSGRDDLALTHEFLAQMLGATRPAVTTTLQKLQAAGTIDQSRGMIRVVDREALRSHSCECYDAIAGAYTAYERGLRNRVLSAES
jgi:CRP-like cAMP-binding protein